MTTLRSDRIRGAPFADSMSHLDAVEDLPPELQEDLLRRADESGWTRRSSASPLTSLLF